MKKIVLLVLVALLIIAASGFSWIWKSFDDSGNYGFEFAGSNSVSIVNSAGQAPSVLEVQAGDQFTLTLDANPTTGYQWDLAQPLNESVLTVVNTEYVPAQTGGIIVGSGGKETWTFLAVGQGTTVISLVYTRPWEENTMPAVAKQFNVTVNPAVIPPVLPEPPIPAPPTPSIPDLPAPGADVTATVGATITFTISQHVVPGGEWMFTQPLDQSILRLMSDDTVSQEGVLGAVDRVLTFLAVGPGLTTVYLANQHNYASLTVQILE